MQKLVVDLVLEEGWGHPPIRIIGLFRVSFRASMPEREPGNNGLSHFCLTEMEEEICTCMLLLFSLDSHGDDVK